MSFDTLLALFEITIPKLLSNIIIHQHVNMFVYQNLPLIFTEGGAACIGSSRVTWFQYLKPIKPRTKKWSKSIAMSCHKNLNTKSYEHKQNIFITDKQRWQLLPSDGVVQVILSSVVRVNKLVLVDASTQADHVWNWRLWFLHRLQ